MDKILTSDTLSDIAGFLPLKDVNSFMRTSKTVYELLETHKKDLPKPKVDVDISYNEFKKEIFIAVKLRDGKCLPKSWKMYKKICQGLLWAVPEDELYRYESDDEKYSVDQVLNFYNQGAGRPFAIPKQACPKGLPYSLSLYMEFLIEKADILRLKVTNLTDADLEAIKGTFKYPASVESIEISCNSMGRSQLDLVSGCNAKYLTISRGSKLPEAFYLMPEVRKLTAIVDNSLSNVMNNAGLLAVEASSFHIERETKVTFSGFKNFLNQWAESKRSVKGFYLILEEEVSKAQFKAMLASMNNLVEIGDHGSRPNLPNSCSLKRRGEENGCDLTLIIQGTDVFCGKKTEYL